VLFLPFSFIPFCFLTYLQSNANILIYIASNSDPFVSTRS
jgi:hypothetical protein